MGLRNCCVCTAPALCGALRIVRVDLECGRSCASDTLSSVVLENARTAAVFVRVHVTRSHRKERSFSCRVFLISEIRVLQVFGKDLLLCKLHSSELLRLLIGSVAY